MFAVNVSWVLWTINDMQQHSLRKCNGPYAFCCATVSCFRDAKYTSTFRKFVLHKYGYVLKWPVLFFHNFGVCRLRVEALHRRWPIVRITLWCANILSVDAWISHRGIIYFTIIITWQNYLLFHSSVCKIVAASRVHPTPWLRLPSPSMMCVAHRIKVHWYLPWTCILSHQRLPSFVEEHWWAMFAMFHQNRTNTEVRRENVNSQLVGATELSFVFSIQFELFQNSPPKNPLHQSYSKSSFGYQFFNLNIASKSVLNNTVFIWRIISSWVFALNKFSASWSMDISCE